ncbi:hypothetical protein MP228_008534 [Amoeboaphelidium protococcarum]|nr:hypothetical protein MP228_008534 [Amoeboaphelidium protococcarum]
MSLFWSLRVEPGKEYSQTVEHTFRLTNVCIDFDASKTKPAGKNVRTVLKVKTSPSFEDLENDTEHTSEFMTVCNLTEQKDQVSLELAFGSGEDVTFMVPAGGYTLCLSGNYIPEEDQYSDDEEDGDQEEYDEDAELYGDEDISDEEIDSDVVDDEDIEKYMSMVRNGSDLSEDDDELLEGSDLDDMSESEDELESGIVKPKIVEVKEEPKAAKEKVVKVESKKPAAAAADKKSVKADSAKSSPAPAVEKKQPEAKKEAPAAAKQQNKKRQNEEAASPAQSSAASSPQEAKKQKSEQQQQQPQRQTLSGGLVVVDQKVGNGEVAKAGKRVQMRYIGKFAPNHPTKAGKQFDANTSGKPFSFVLGRGEVIQGWDQGIVGMKVGGQRKLEIPSKLAYGKKGAGRDIPPNSDLVFEVKLLNVK